MKHSLWLPLYGSLSMALSLSLSLWLPLYGSLSMAPSLWLPLYHSLCITLFSCSGDADATLPPMRVLLAEEIRCVSSLSHYLLLDGI